MTIRPRHILTIRAVALWSFRLVAAILIGYGGFLIAARLFFRLFLGGPNGMFTYMGVGADHGLVRGVPMLTIGIVLAFLSRRLVRWVVAMPELGCPRCGYAGSGRPGKCPECGLDDVGPDATGDDLKT